jgi:hypothetical protein
MEEDEEIVAATPGAAPITAFPFGFKTWGYKPFISLSNPCHFL